MCLHAVFGQRDDSIFIGDTDAHIRIEQELHALKLHSRRHLALRWAGESGVVDRNAVEEPRRPSRHRWLIARLEFDMITHHGHRELRALAEMQPFPKRLRQNQPAVFFERDPSCLK